jgi:hypothetical protein
LDAVGTPVAVQQKLMRHADIRTTFNIYRDVVTNEMAQAHSKVVRLAIPRASRFAVICAGVSTLEAGGESGIRTHVTLSSKHAFQACAFSHSAISPEAGLLREALGAWGATRESCSPILWPTVGKPQLADRGELKIGELKIGELKIGEVKIGELIQLGNLWGFFRADR